MMILLIDAVCIGIMAVGIAFGAGMLAGFAYLNEECNALIDIIDEMEGKTE